jgi:hypothetical protein
VYRHAVDVGKHFVAMSRATHETRSVLGEHNRRVTILKLEFRTSFGTIIVVVTRTRSVQTFLMLPLPVSRGNARFPSGLAPIGRDYGQENFVAAIRADGAANLSHDLLDILGQHAALCAKFRNLRIGAPAENDDDGARDTHSRSFAAGLATTTT